VLGAADVGAPHQRDRFWLVAHADDSRQRADPRGREGRWQGETRHDAGWCCDDLADADRERFQELGGGGSDESGHAGPEHGGATLAYTELWFNALGRNDAGMGWLAELGQEGDAGTRFWGAEPDVGRVADGVAARVDRLKAIGNGQVPLCAATAWRLLGGC
jgi:DNA (cytosine-5)-methyltransferase 1